MSQDIDVALVATYKSNIEVKFQQQGSRLRPCVRNEAQNSEFDFYDRIGPTEAVEITTRHGDTPLIETDHDRRRVQLRDFDWADLIDRRDKIRMLADPASSYTINAVYGLGRKMDRLIIDSALGSAFSGKAGATTTSYDTTYQIATTYNEDATSTARNMTIGKLRKARQLLNSAEAVQDGEKLTCVITSNQEQKLLASTEIGSHDYNDIKALVHGDVNSFMGFDFVRTELVTKSSNTRKCLAFPKQALVLATAAEIMVDVGPRRDKRLSTQVYVCASFGASRMWEEAMIEIDCDETA